MALRILAILTVLTLVLTSWVGKAEAVSGTTIANKAKEYADAGLTNWTYAAAHPDASRFDFRQNLVTDGSNARKSHLFVADVFEAVGVTVPHRRVMVAPVPISAWEWGYQYTSYLTISTLCWELRSYPSVGYVISDRTYVGIVTGANETTIAASAKLLSVDWGFRDGSGFGSRSSITAYWEYVC
ncbi:uncharacterized protein [Asterias amurensis]|uniref:uncharacterized protein n=1 Tax=Asterias amurensis TaxID=7602 RepID=UPI003AB731F2